MSVIKEPPNDINDHPGDDVYIYAPAMKTHTVVHVAFFLFDIFKLNFNQFSGLTLGFSCFHLWLLSTERLCWVQS